MKSNLKNLTFKTPSEGLSYNDRVLLIDGLNFFIRSFSVVPVTNQEGQHVGGLYGFLYSLSNIVKKLRPTRIIISFDGINAAKQRKKMNSEYKSNRAIKDSLNRSKNFETPEQESESMKIQFKRLYEYLLVLPVHTIIMDNVEADDIISFLAGEVFDNEVIICSTDKDYYQLIDDRITVYNPIKKEIVNKNDVLDTFNVTPANFIYYKCLTGDASDNIKGINGIGPVTISKFDFLKEENRLTLDEFKTNLSPETNKEKLILDNFNQVEDNFEIMQLHDPLIGGSLKLKIMDIIRRPLMRYNKFIFRKLFLEDKINATNILNNDIMFTQLFSLYTNFKNE